MEKTEWIKDFEAAFVGKTNWPLEEVREFMQQTGDEHWDALIALDVDPADAARDEYDGIMASL